MVDGAAAPRNQTNNGRITNSLGGLPRDGRVGVLMTMQSATVMNAPSAGAVSNTSCAPARPQIGLSCQFRWGGTPLSCGLLPRAATVLAWLSATIRRRSLLRGSSDAVAVARPPGAALPPAFQHNVRCSENSVVSVGHHGALAKMHGFKIRGVTSYGVMSVSVTVYGCLLLVTPRVFP